MNYRNQIKGSGFKKRSSSQNMRLDDYLIQIFFLKTYTDSVSNTSDNDDNVADKDVNNVLECVSYSDFKMMVKDWLSIEGFGPKFSDVMLIGYFLKGMVQRKLIERVKATLDFISR